MILIFFLCNTYIVNYEFAVSVYDFVSISPITSNLSNGRYFRQWTFLQ